MRCARYASCGPSAAGCGCSSRNLSSKLQTSTPRQSAPSTLQQTPQPLLFFLPCPQQNAKTRLRSNPMSPTITTTFTTGCSSSNSRSHDSLDTLLPRSHHPLSSHRIGQVRSSLEPPPTHYNKPSDFIMFLSKFLPIHHHLNMKTPCRTVLDQFHTAPVAKGSPLQSCTLQAQASGKKT